MLKKHSIITLLLFAYTLVLGHSIIPHHHHQNDSHETKQSEHHHHDNHHKDNHHDNEDESLVVNFENYLHSGDTQDLQQQSDGKITTNAIHLVYIISFFEFQINAIQSPPPVVRLSNDCIPLAQQCLSIKGLRAPPCNLV